jgi:hypothetical protein
MTTLPITRKYDWEAEKRYLSKRVQEDQRRIEELDEILAAMFPEGAR